ncbi:MAG TPA: DUF3971 domain-containing protein [Candidatus Binatia bacterium]|nr:DUF3971 domain-containing protein [Candidatus Binatia bacterium]
MNTPGASLRAEFDRVELGWNGFGRGIDLRLRDLRLLAPSGEEVATVPVLSVRLSLRALLRGAVAPVAVGLRKPRLTLRRHADGGFDLGIGEGKTVGGQAAFIPMLEGLRGAAPPHSPFAALRSVRVEGGALKFVDESRGTHVAAIIDEFALGRRPDDIRGELTVTVTLGTTPVPLIGTLHAFPTGALDGTMTFGAVAPIDIADLFASGSSTADALRRLRVPLRGSVGFALDPALRLTHARGFLRGTAGTVALPELSAGALSVEHGRLAARFDRAADAVDLKLALDAPGFDRLRMHGRASGLSGPGTLRAEVIVSGLTTDAFAGYWPPHLAANVRQWITTHVAGGRIPEAHVALSAGLGGLDARTLALRALHGAMTFETSEVRYLDSMPPARAATGRAHFSIGQWTLTVTHGRVDGLTIAHTTVAPTDGEAGGPTRLAVTGHVRGSLAEALRVLGQLPLGYAKALGTTPNQVAGTMAARFTLALPLSDPTRLEITSSAELTDVAVPTPLRGARFEGGALTVVQDASSVRVTGHGRLAGTPVVLDWTEWTEPTAGARRSVRVSGQLDDASRAALGLDLRPWVQGPTDVRVQLTQDERGRVCASISGDLRPALVALPLLPQKSPGQPGRIQAELVLDGDSVRRVEEFDLGLDDTRVRGHATLAADGRTPTTLDADAALPPRAAGARPAHLALTLRPAARGQTATLSSNDVGAVLRATGSYADAIGGRMRYAATADLVAPGTPFDGRLAIHGVTITRMPWLAQAATLASLSGTASALAGGGIRFDRVTGRVAYRDGSVTIIDGVMSGPSLRVLVEGSVDTNRRTLALAGTLIPAYYGLNELPSRIPMVGGLVTGGQGLQAFDFAVSGTPTAPTVSVKLSSLAPGALRNLLRRLGL